MGIQINGQTDTISAIDGALTVSGADLPTVTNLNATGIVTTTKLTVGVGGTVITTTSTGFVGIGTTNPDTTFDVRGNVQFGSNMLSNTKIAKTFTPTHVSSNRGSKILFGLDDGSFSGLVVTNVVGSNSSFNSQNVSIVNHNGGVQGDIETLTCKYDGTVGIGTSSPEAKLDVWGQDINEGNAYGQIIIRDTSAYNASPVSGIIFKGEHTPGAAAYFASIYGGKENATDGNYAGYLALSTRTQGSTAAERVRIDSNGNFSIIQTPGRYSIDTTGGAVTIANGGTIDFPAASGMLVVNNWTDGRVTIYLCGGGATAVIGSVGGQVGSFAYNASVAGYRWTNTYGSSAVFGFFFVRTRTTA
jgi:hypothetical protein